MKVYISGRLAAGQIAAVLVYSPDRLSRKYAYQVLLAEELARCGVELIFLQAPSTVTAEDQLLVQFQGMLAEYERAQIAERSRRGKRHRAPARIDQCAFRSPYGYRYIKKTDTSAAYYQVIEAEAEVVRTIFNWYTRTGLSIGAITRRLPAPTLPSFISCFRLRAPGRTGGGPTGPGAFRCRRPPFRLSRRGQLRTSQVPFRSVPHLCRAPRPRPDRHVLAISNAPMLPPYPTQRRLQQTHDLVANTRLQHPLSTLHELRCRCPCKTGFRLAGSPSPGGSRTL
jgi:hypothetical protein